MVLIVALVLLWFIARNAAVLALSERSPRVAMNFAPASPRAILADATWEGLSPASSVTPEIRRQLATVARNAPLAYEPFLAAAVQSLKQRQNALATRRMEEVVRRNPRLIPAYLFLAERYLRAGRSEEALAKIAIALRLPMSLDEGSRLMQALYLLADDAKGRNALSRALTANPPWRTSFVQYAAGRGGDAGRLFNVVQTSSANEDERRSFLAGLVAAKDYERAYLAWINFLPATALAEVTPIYDGTFRKLPGSPPFNWELFTSDSATAEMVDGAQIPPGTALAANFFGSVRTTIASQTMLVPPGAYTLSVAATGNSESVLGGSFAWELSCLPDAAPVARILFTELREKPMARRTAVTIPPDCKAQVLTLFGVPGETSAQVQAEFGAISLKPR